MNPVGVWDDLTSDILAYLRLREDCLKKYEYRSPQLLQRVIVLASDPTRVTVDPVD
jgi:hypothetical protein